MTSENIHAAKLYTHKPHYLFFWPASQKQPELNLVIQGTDVCFEVQQSPDSPWVLRETIN